MTSINELLNRFRPGERLFLPGSSAEPRPLVEALSMAAPSLPDIEVSHNFLPGINTVPLAANNNDLREVAVFPRANSPAPDSISTLPISYFGARQYFAAQRFDWVVAHMAPPDANGHCSLGTSVEFTYAALSGAKNVIGIINSAMPAVPGTASVPLSDLTSTIEVDWPLVSYDPGPPDGISIRISRWLARLIPDGSVLQTGLGRTPACLLESLSGARNLRLHSGLLSQGIRKLAEAGALDPQYKHVGCTTLGTADFYTWLAQRNDLNICDVQYSHHPSLLARLKNFIAINSALEVDLLGQANLETAAGRAVSGIGGAPDFSRGARYSVGGKSIIALPATAKGGTVSRIVSGFAPGQPVSLGRTDIDYVVTEFGIASLVNKPAPEKARALIEVAAPKFREQLSREMYNKKDLK